MQRTLAGAVVFLLVSLGLGVPEASAFELTAHLVPEKGWNQGQPAAADYLAEGTVYLYRKGEYEPALALPANEPSVVPKGIWFWIAEAPGFVSAVSGSFGVKEQDEATRTLILPVVPACEIDLTADRWLGVARLDLVSLSRDAVFPVNPRKQQRMAIPEGRALAYTVGARGVTAISELFSCRRSEVFKLPRPEPPQADRQDAMVSAVVPDAQGVALEDLSVTLGVDRAGAQQAPRPPTASIRIGRRQTSFFLDQPAGENVQIELRHPELRRSTTVLHPLGGGVRELPDIELRPRVTVELSLDYRPAREHEKQTLQALLCGRRPPRYFEDASFGRCSEVGTPVNLSPDVTEYVLEGLDVGWYVLAAKIDDEEVFGLGSQASVYVTGETPDVLPTAVDPLRELHIYGSLLVEDEPVPGRVLLTPHGEAFPETLVFPTDDDLLYHMYFFAQTPSVFGKSRLPPELKERDARELRGMYDGYQLQACSDDGYCRLFHTRSTLSGEGRLDIDLGADRELRVSVTDRATGDPIANAGVIVGANAKQKTETFHFADGEVIQVRDTHEPLGALTDATGVVKVRGLGAGPQRIAVVAEGYESLAKSITPIDHGQIDLKIELTSEEDTESDPEALTLRFEDRQPVPRAYFLSLTPDGRVDYPCSASTDHRGEVRLPEACLAQDSKRFFVLHPEARLAEFSAGQLRQSSEVFVRRNRAQPVYVRFVDAEGRPLVARPLDLRFGRLSLGPNHFLAAMSRTGLDIPFRTGSGGEIAIRLVEANGARPEVGLADSAGHDWFRIDGEPGQMVEVLVDE